MAPKKKQHYTPNFILSGFADDATRTLWVWDKSQRTCRPVRGTPRYDAFTQNHYYTLKDTSGNHDLSVENYLAGLEDEAARIITDLIRFALAPLYPPPNFKKKRMSCPLSVGAAHALAGCPSRDCQQRRNQADVPRCQT